MVTWELKAIYPRRIASEKGFLFLEVVSKPGRNTVEAIPEPG
jgi:hypothetical protein